MKAPPTRREFLESAVASAAGAALVKAAPRLIDVHHHVFPPEFVRANLRTYIPQNRGVVSDWTPQKSLAEMDVNGVATAIVSMASPGTWTGEVQASRTLTRQCNEYSAKLARDRRGRFGFFAALPLPDTDGSLQEVAYALDVLKADGVSLMTNYGGKYLGDASFAPVFDELDKRGAIVHVHPTSQNASMTAVAGVPGAWAELPQETTRTTLSLIVSGTLLRHRRVRFILPHAGGTLPMLAGRISQATRYVDDFSLNAPQGIVFELQRLYYDIAISANRSAMSALTNLVPTANIMFGGDYPFVPIASTAGSLTGVGLSNADQQAIAYGNASALLTRGKD
jgi:6-methylsalicylate decarboxylase